MPGRANRRPPEYCHRFAPANTCHQPEAPSSFLSAKATPGLHLSAQPTRIREDSIASSIPHTNGITVHSRDTPRKQSISLKPHPASPGYPQGVPLPWTEDYSTSAFVHGRGTLYGYPEAGPGMGNSALCELVCHL